MIQTQKRLIPLINYTNEALEGFLNQFCHSRAPPFQLEGNQDVRRQWARLIILADVKEEYGRRGNRGENRERKRTHLNLAAIPRTWRHCQGFIRNLGTLQRNATLACLGSEAKEGWGKSFHENIQMLSTISIVIQSSYQLWETCAQTC